MSFSDICQGIKEHSNSISESTEMQTDIRKFELNIRQKIQNTEQLLCLPLNKKKMLFLTEYNLIRILNPKVLFILRPRRGRKIAA